MKRNNAYRVLVLTIAFLILGIALLLPLATNGVEPWILWIILGAILAAYIGSMVWSLVYYGRKNRNQQRD